MPATSPASATVIPPHHDPARSLGAALGAWITRASCAGEDTGIFFPPADSPATEARRICASCPVRRHCLSYALAAGEEHGILGRPGPAGTKEPETQAATTPGMRQAGQDGSRMTPEQRRLRAKIAANARWSRPMAREDQADAARSAIFAQLEREVDPAGELSPDERAILVRAAARRLSAKLNASRARKRAMARAQALLPGPQEAVR
jgi:Transcription factor WhiB